MAQDDGRVQVGMPTDYEPFVPPRRNEVVPVDFSQRAPPLAPTSQYFALANALKTINPDIQSVANSIQSDQDKKSAEQGAAQALATGKAYGDAVRDGSISADQNPLFVKAWKELDGKNKADSGFAQVQQDYEQDPIRNSADPQAVQQWVQQKTAGVMQGITDPDELVGAASKAGPFQQQLYAQQAQQVKANTLQGMTDAAAAQIGSVVDQYKAGSQNGGPTTTEGLATAINGTMNLPKFVGMDPKLTDAITVGVLSDKAKFYRDPSLLDALNQPRQDINNPDNLVPGVGTSLMGQSTIVKTRQEIQGLQAQDLARQWQLQEHQIATAKQSGEKQAFDTIAQNGTLTPTDITNIGKVSPEAGLMAFEVNQKMRQTTDYSSPNETAQFLYRMNAGDTGRNDDGSQMTAQQFTLDEIRNGRLSGNSDFVKSLMSQASDVDREGVYKYADAKRAVDRMAGADTDPLAPKVLADPAEGYRAAADLAQRITQSNLQERAAGKDPAATIQARSLDLFNQTLADHLKAQSSTPQPASPTAQAAPESSSAKLDTISAGDQKLLQKYRGTPNDPAVAAIRDKYTPHALEAFGLK